MGESNNQLDSETRSAIANEVNKQLAPLIDQISQRQANMENQLASFYSRVSQLEQVSGKTASDIADDAANKLFTALERVTDSLEDCEAQINDVKKCIDLLDTYQNTFNKFEAVLNKFQASADSTETARLLNNLTGAVQDCIGRISTGSDRIEQNFTKLVSQIDAKVTEFRTNIMNYTNASKDADVRVASLTSLLDHLDDYLVQMRDLSSSGSKMHQYIQSVLRANETLISAVAKKETDYQDRWRVLDKETDRRKKVDRVNMALNAIQSASSVTGNVQKGIEMSNLERYRKRLI